MGSPRVSRRGLILGAVGATGAIGLAVAWEVVSGVDRNAVTVRPGAVATSPGTVPLKKTVASQLAVQKEIILELVATAENTTKNWPWAYAYIEDIGDDRGYTAGIVGWCSGTGDMLELVRRYTLTTPGNPLQKYLPALRQIMAAPEDSRTDLSHTLLDPTFTTAWATAATTGQFQAAQRDERDRVYWNPAWAAAMRDHLSPLGRYLYYDIIVNHGPAADPESFGGIVAGVKASGHRSPAQGGDETAYLTAIIAARDLVLKNWGNYQRRGRSAIGLKFLADKNLNLTLPLTWNVYGNTYSITSPPEPRESDIAVRGSL
jgi:chitosanase